MDYLFPVDLTRVHSKLLHVWQDDEYLSPALRLKIGDELDRRLYALDIRLSTGAERVAQPPTTSPESDDNPQEWEQWDREATREVRFQDDTEGM
jgi:hypothetical protein